MVKIPENEITEADLTAWYNMSDQLRVLRAKEMLLRKKIFGAAFPNPKEGTNNYTLADNYVLKGKYIIQRNVDEAALTTLTKTLRKEKIPIDSLVKYKPSLVKSEYNKLTAEEKQKFDQCLIIKPGSPSLEIAAPKKAKK